MFGRLAKAMGAPELAADPRYADHVARAQNQHELDARITEWTSQHAAAEVQSTLDEHGVPCSKLYRAEDMLSDTHYAEREAVVTAPSDRYGEVPMQGVFPKLSKTPGRVRHSGKGLPK